MLDAPWFGEGSNANKNTAPELICSVRLRTYQTGLLDGDWFEKKSRQQAYNMIGSVRNHTVTIAPYRLGPNWFGITP